MARGDSRAVNARTSEDACELAGSRRGTRGPAPGAGTPHRRRNDETEGAWAFGFGVRSRGDRIRRRTAAPQTVRTSRAAAQDARTGPWGRDATPTPERESRRRLGLRLSSEESG